MNALVAMGVAGAIAAGLSIGWVVATPQAPKPVNLHAERAHQAAELYRKADQAQRGDQAGDMLAAVGREAGFAFKGMIGQGGVDADTEETGHNTLKMFGSEVVFAQPHAGGLSPPRYLPAWAPVYPGAELKQKLKQKKDGQVVGRGTEFSTNDDFDRVAGFYDAYYRDHGVTPAKVITAKYGKIYIFDARNGYQSMVNLQNLGTGGDKRVVHIAIAQAASE